MSELENILKVFQHFKIQSNSIYCQLLKLLINGDCKIFWQHARFLEQRTYLKLPNKYKTGLVKSVKHKDSFYLNKKSKRIGISFRNGSIYFYHKEKFYGACRDSRYYWLHDDLKINPGLRYL